jgi:phage recombination protein Bet
MNNENGLVKVDYCSSEKKELIKRTIFKGSTDDELEVFIGICNRTQLDPFARQIFAIKRWDSKEGKEVMSSQVSIDGLRLVAQRSGEYEGQTQPEWCGNDGVWKNIWVSKELPFASRIGIWRKGFREPCFAIAKFDSYAQITKDGNLNSIWRRFPELMISKCAEALALRKAFPQELSGLYTTDEMGQVDNVEKQINSEQIKTLSEEVLECFIADIEKAQTEIDLRKVFVIAYKAAEELQDKQAMTAINNAKDKRKKELQVQK